MKPLDSRTLYMLTDLRTGARAIYGGAELDKRRGEAQLVRKATLAEARADRIDDGMGGLTTWPKGWQCADGVT